VQVVMSLELMALDIYWKEWQHERYLGSLEIDMPLDGLLHEFGKLTGIVIDPYRNNRLHPTLCSRLRKSPPAFQRISQMECSYCGETKQSSQRSGCPKS
jgi:hypothetical protein